MTNPTTDFITTHFQSLLPLAVDHVLNAIEAMLILLAGIWLSGKVHRWVLRALTRAPHFDEMLRGFFASLARYAVLTITGVAVLSQFGIQTTSLVAVLGAAGLAIGLALQGTLSNLAAGIMLLIFRPFRIGQKVQIGGVTGTVRELSLFWTEILSDDQVQNIVPNGSVWGQTLRNYSIYPAPLAGGEARFRVSATQDPDQMMAAVRTALDAHPKIIHDPPPNLLFDRVAADNSLEIVAAFKTKDGDVPTIRSDLFRAVGDAMKPPPTPARPAP